MPTLENRIALITGGASGIGWGIAEAMLAEGASVVLADLNVEALALRQATDPARITTIQTDVTVEADCAAMVDAAIDAHGRLDIAVNAAGLGVFGEVADLDFATWRHCVSVCLDGVFLSSHFEAAVMRSQGSGVIINIASINAKVPAVGMSAYCSAKAGVEMLTRCAAMELGPAGVRVCGIGPGLIDTPLTAFAGEGEGANAALREAYLKTIPMGRVGRTDDVADVAVFLASDAARWVSGETIYVDGAESTNGYPNFLDVFNG